MSGILFLSPLIETFILIFNFLISNPVTDEINKILYSETDYKINKIESLKEETHEIKEDFQNLIRTLSS